jgi:hypothetical protein
MYATYAIPCFRRFCNRKICNGAILTKVLSVAEFLLQNLRKQGIAYVAYIAYRAYSLGGGGHAPNLHEPLRTSANLRTPENLCTTWGDHADDHKSH